MKLLRKIMLVSGLFAAFGSSLHAQESDAERRAHARERWEAMSEGEQALFRERFERLRQLPPEERQALLDLAADVERRKRELFDELSAESKRRLAALPPERRELILREYFDECERVRGLRLREQLPPEFLERLESVPPEQRRGLMREFHREMRERAGERMLGEMRREMELSPERLSELSKLPENERGRAMLELKRESIREHVRAHGLPPDVTEAEWKELDALPFDEFFLRWGHHRGERFGGGLRELFRRRPEGARPEGEGDLRGPGRFGERREERRDDRRPRPGTGEGPRGRGEFIDDLFRLAHPNLDDLLENEALPPNERRAEVTRIVRARCLKFLEGIPIMDPAELARLQALSPDDFVREIRSFLGEARGSRWRRLDAERPPRSDR